MPIKGKNIVVYDGRIPRLLEKDEPKMSNVRATHPRNLSLLLFSWSLHSLFQQEESLQYLHFQNLYGKNDNTKFGPYEIATVLDAHG